MPDAQPRAVVHKRRTRTTTIQQRPRALPDLEQHGPQASPSHSDLSLRLASHPVPGAADTFEKIWNYQVPKELMAPQPQLILPLPGGRLAPLAPRSTIPAPLRRRPPAARFSSQSSLTPLKRARRHFLRSRRLARRFHLLRRRRLNPTRRRSFPTESRNPAVRSSATASRYPKILIRRYPASQFRPRTTR